MQNENIIKPSECPHKYWDEGRCIDCGKSFSETLNAIDNNIWAPVKITTVRIGNGAKVHYANDGGSVTFCNLYRGIRKAYSNQVTCERCIDSVRARENAGKLGNQ